MERGGRFLVLFFFFLNGFFVHYQPPLPSLASVSDTIKGIGKDAGPAPARQQEEWLTPLLPAAFLVVRTLLDERRHPLPLENGSGRAHSLS